MTDLICTRITLEIGLFRISHDNTICKIIERLTSISLIIHNSGYMCIDLRISLFWIWNDDNIRINNWDWLTHPVIIRNFVRRWPAVVLGRAHVTPFRIWAYVSIFCNTAVISASVSAAMLNLMTKTMMPIPALRKMLLSGRGSDFFLFEMTSLFPTYLNYNMLLLFSTCMPSSYLWKTVSPIVSLL